MALDTSFAHRLVTLSEVCAKSCALVKETCSRNLTLLAFLQLSQTLVENATTNDYEGTFIGCMCVVESIGRQQSA